MNAISGRGNREALPELASCGKAFTSMAVGMMLRDKAKEFPDGLDQKVFAPKFLGAEYFPLDDPRKAEISLGQLLSMSAGLKGDESGVCEGREADVGKSDD